MNKERALNNGKVARAVIPSGRLQRAVGRWAVMRSVPRAQDSHSLRPFGTFVNSGLIPLAQVSNLSKVRPLDNEKINSKVRYLILVRHTERSYDHIDFALARI